MKAKRYNKGKLRYELLPQYALEKLVEVYTKGAHKYTVYTDKKGNKIKGADIPFEDLPNLDLNVLEDGANNWRLGQNWSGSMASVKRHISEWEKGIDVDSDPSMNTYHLANAAWGLFSLLEYYKIYPQGDDRQHGYLSTPKIGLDIDEVLCDWVGGWVNKFGLDVPTSWYFDRNIVKRFEELRSNNELDDFYLNLLPKINPQEIPFEPHCYITSRPVDINVTIKWLDKNGFPARPVYCVGSDESKVEVAKKSGIDIFVDDRYDNFVELNQAGICTYLYDAPHNQRYNVGYKRIFSLKDFNYGKDNN